MPIQTPFNLLSPEMLAQMAQGAFKPPQPMAMPGMQQQPQQQPGFNVGQAVAGLGAGLAGWKPDGYQKPTPVLPDYQSGPLTPGSVSGSPVQPGQMISTSAIDRTMDPSLGTPQQSGGGLNGLLEFFTGASLDKLGMPDFANGTWADKLGFTGGGSSGWGG